MEVQTKHFKRNSRVALQDGSIQKALTGIVSNLHEGRERAIQAVTPEAWEKLRDQASAIKTHTIENLDYYLDLLERNIRRSGGHVHFARNAKEANAIVVDIAKRNNVGLVVKTKSMVSEEIGVNDALADARIESVETDLGEYIQQLADEPPFHIVGPAMHRSKENVADLFVRKTGSLRHRSIEELCQEARRQLRNKFLQADMGITGANLMVAETGTIVLVTNEGNGRMCTSLPRVHVALVGMEKLVPTLEDVPTFIRLLPRAASGQSITSYVNFVSGPRGSGHTDGPEELHVVILDNGRSRLLADPDLRESLNCIRCGACLNACPIFRKVGGHSYGWVYSGPIGAVITPMLTGLKGSRDLPFASTLCGACRDVCPVKINIPHMLLKLRAKSTQDNSQKMQVTAPRLERLGLQIWNRIVHSPVTFQRVGHLMGLLQGLLGTKGRILGIPLPYLSSWGNARDIPRLTRISFRRRWAMGLGGEGQGDDGGRKDNARSE